MKVVPSLTEPEVGTVAVFDYELLDGGHESTGKLIRTAAGWAATPDVRGAVSWESLIGEARFSADPAARSFRSCRMTIVSEA